MDYLMLRKSNCLNCHKCIRNCPVKAIRFSGSHAYIIPEECVLCGTCFVVCPQNAKRVSSEVEKVRQLLAGPDPVVVSIAPSFIANYNGSGICAMREALLKLGFADVQETAIGATMVKREYERMLAEETKDIIITTCCNSVNLLIQRYYPSLVGYMAEVLSPMQAHCKLLKQQNPNAKTVFIGPCISKMEEADHYPGLVDAVLNFDQLDEWLAAEGITLRMETDFDEETRARFFPATGGVLKTMDITNMGYTYMAVDGPENCINVLDDIRDNQIHRCFIEMNMCLGGCVGGPIMERHQHAPVRDHIAITRSAGKKDFPVAQPSPEFMHKSFDTQPIRATMPSEELIRTVLRQMGKTTPRDELNCGTCGYNTCREKAIAVCQGKAEIKMCLPYLMGKNETFSDTVFRNMPGSLIVASEGMEIQQINQQAVKLFGLNNQDDALGEDIGLLMDPTDFVEVLETGRGIREKQVFLSDLKKYVSETILYDRTYHIFICLLRDITKDVTSALQKEEQSRATAEAADRVIAHQMRVVQEIASLLGETAAETQVALNKLKESIADE